MAAGVPQGSVLAPTLYTIFTSDMPLSENVTFATYADDTALITSHESPDFASAAVQQAINKIEEWLKKWNIKVNADKSTHVTFTLRKGDCPAITMNGSLIPAKNSVKYLGIHLDRRLTWKEHIKAKKNNLI